MSHTITQHCICKDNQWPVAAEKQVNMLNECAEKCILVTKSQAEPTSSVQFSCDNLFLHEKLW